MSEFTQLSGSTVALEVEDLKPTRRKYWGCCKPYLFDEHQEPVIVIGPHWPLFSCAYLVFVVISAVMVNFAMSNNMGLPTILMTVFICSSQLISYLLVAMRNPGVANSIDNQTSNEAPLGRRGLGHIWYCEVCQLRQLPSTVHCIDCKVCILEMDHHCPWTGKCIGRGNLKEFYGFLVCTLIYMIYNIIITMAQTMPNIQNIKQK